MAIVLTCHLIETIWSKRDSGARAPYMVIDHNGQQHQTEVMKGGAVTVWNTKATFPYAPSSDLVVMAFDAAGRQPGAFIAQAVVDVAVMLQQGSLNASAALVNRKGHNVGVVLFDVGLVTSSRALAAGLDIPSLTFSTQPCPDSPTARLQGGASSTTPLSPTAAAAAAAAVNGRSSPFAQLAVQRGVTTPPSGSNGVQPATPGSAQSMGQKLVGSISQALVGALLGLETRDREQAADTSPSHNSGSMGRSRSYSPRRTGTLSRSLDCSPTGRANNRTAAASNTLSRRSLVQQQQHVCNKSMELQQQLLYATGRASSTAVASAPPAVAASDRASFSAWRQSRGSSNNNGPLTAARPVAVSAAGACGQHAAAHHHQPLPQRMAASANGRLADSSSCMQQQQRPSSSAAAAAVSLRGSEMMLGSATTRADVDGATTHNSSSSRSLAEARRPSRLTVPPDCPAPLGDANSASSLNANGGTASLSPLTEARARLRLQRQQPLPPLSQLFPQPRREGLIPVGRAPPSPGGFSQATTTGYSRYSTTGLSVVGPEGSASADYDALLREFDAADAAGKEAILYRELTQQQQIPQHQPQLGSASSSQLLSLLNQQHQQEILEHQQLMKALEGMTADSPKHHIPAPRAAAAAAAGRDAFRSCFSSSTQITSGSSSSGSDGGAGSSGDGGASSGSPYKHYPSLPEFNQASAAARQQSGPAAAAKQKVQQQQQDRAAAAGSAASGAGSPHGPAAGALLQQLGSDECDNQPLLSTRQGHKLLGDRVGQLGSPSSAQSSPMSATTAAAEAAAAVRQVNWQLLQRMRQQELAAAAAAVSAAAAVPSYPISHSGTEFSDGMSDAEATPRDGSEASSNSPRPSRQHRQQPVKPAYTCNKAPGQLAGYTATNSSNSNSGNSNSSSDQAGSQQKRSSRWVAPVRDANPYCKPPPTFPIVAVSVEPTAPLMAVSEEYPCV